MNHSQSYNVDSPSEMVVDAEDYVGVTSIPEKETVAIINPDGPDQSDVDQQLQDLPLANDRTYSDSPVSGVNSDGPG